MAHYLVHAHPDPDALTHLRSRLERGEIRALRPFGRALEHSLRGARKLPDGRAVWEEEDYCSPPLAMERAAVLDACFRGIEVERVEAGAGWQRIAALPSLWGDDPPP